MLLAASPCDSRTASAWSQSVFGVPGFHQFSHPPLTGFGIIGYRFDDASSSSVWVSSYGSIHIIELAGDGLSRAVPDFRGRQARLRLQPCHAPSFILTANLICEPFRSARAPRSGVSREPSCMRATHQGRLDVTSRRRKPQFTWISTSL